MVEVFLLTTDQTSDKVGKIKAWLSALQATYPHKLQLVDLRQQVIEMGVIPPVEQWHTINPNL